MSRHSDDLTKGCPVVAGNPKFYFNISVIPIELLILFAYNVNSEFQL